jgi:hypothetical protein
MAIQFIASASAYAAASGNSLSCSSMLNVQAGDILVACLCCDNTGRSPSASDGGSNSFTILPEATYATYIGYILVAAANSAATFTFNLGTADTHRGIIVRQYRPSSGATISVEAGPVSAEATSASLSSASFSTTGTDELVVACGWIYSGTLSSRAVGATSGANLIDLSTYLKSWDVNFSSAQSNIAATGSLSASVYWDAHAIAIKAVSSGITGSGATAQSKQSQSSLGSQSISGVLADSQTKQGQISAGAQSLSGSGSTSQKAQVQTAAGGQSLSGSGACAQVKQTQAASGLQSMTGSSTSVQQYQTQMATGQIGNTISGISATTQARQFQIAIGSQSIQALGICTQARQTQTGGNISGTHYNPGDILTIVATTKLYAQWEAIST